jgi:cell division protein ZapA
MANVNIKFNNKDYLLSCDDGQEKNLKELAHHLDSKYNELKQNLGNIGENKLLLIAAIQMVDDYFDLFKKVKNAKNDFEKLSIRFKELKLLAIQYKDEKDVEIQKLKNEVDDFKKMVEKSKNSYEEILDKTTKSIEKFIENAEVDQEKNIQ